MLSTGTILAQVVRICAVDVDCVIQIIHATALKDMTDCRIAQIVSLSTIHRLKLIAHFQEPVLLAHHGPTKRMM